MSPEPDESAEIRSQIERTREEMSETIGEIQERLRPDHLMQQAKETVSDAATAKAREIMHSAGDTAHRMADRAQVAGRESAGYARTHPGQMALVAGGLTWWLLRRNRDRYGYRTAYGRSSAGYGTGTYQGGRQSEYITSSDDASEEYGSSIGETASEYVETAQDGVRRVTGKLRGVAENTTERTRETWERTSTTVDQWVHENPLAAGTLALAVGMAIGMTAPRTDLEDRTLGEARDQALETASRKAQELKQTVTQDVVQNVANAVVGGTGDSGGSSAS